MSSTLNAYSTYNPMALKTFLRCNDNFSSAIALDRGQILLRITVAMTSDFKAPPPLTDRTGWEVQIAMNDPNIPTNVIGKIYLSGKDSTGNDSVSLIQHPVILSDADVTYICTIRSIKEADGKVTSYSVPTETLKSSFGNLKPIAIVYEVV